MFSGDVITIGKIDIQSLNLQKPKESLITFKVSTVLNSIANFDILREVPLDLDLDLDPTRILWLDLM